MVVKLRHRARLRTKEIARIRESLLDALGVSPLGDTENVDRAEATDAWDVVLVDHKPLVLVIKGDPERVFPTVRGLIETRPLRRHVTVDMGAIKFVANGADVMAPGIVEADPSIRPGDLVWVRDERNGQPLAIGEALVPGTAMPRGPKGKAVKSIHRVGDELWTLEP